MAKGGMSKKLFGPERASRGPIIRMVNPATETHSKVGGVECCCCRCFTCIHVEFLKTPQGILKLLETIISGFIQSLLVTYGLRYSSNIGSAFEGALTTSSGCFIVSLILLLCYVISEKSFRLIRSSLFEAMFNTFSCFFYATSASYLAFATKVFLWPLYIVTPGFEVFPAMTAAYMFCGVACIVYGADAYLSWKDYRSS